MYLTSSATVKMKSIIVIVLLVFGVLINSCDKVINGIEIHEVPDWYPMYLVADEDLLTGFDSVWTIFMEENEIDPYKIEVDSVLGHLSRFIDYGKQFQLCVFDDTVDSLVVFNESIVEFLNIWYRLVSIEPIHISSMDYDEFNGFFGAEVYSESFYSYPLYGGIKSLGSVGIRINSMGRMNYLRSTLIPQLQIPEEAIITKNQAKSNLSGYNYTIYSWGGFEDRILSINDIEESALEVYIRRIAENGNVIRLDYHLVWRFTAFDGDFFVDSQTSEVVDFIQGWVSL